MSPAGKKILVVRVGALGDTLMATPLVMALAQAEPDSRIDFLCSAGVAGALDHHPALHRVFSLRQRNWPIVLSGEKRRLIRALKGEHYDLAILLEDARRYHQLLERCGIREVRSFDTHPHDPSLHASRNQLAVAGFKDWRKMPLRPCFRASPEQERRADELLANLRPPRIGIHCGYGPDGKKARPDRLKGWRPGNFVALGRSLMADGASLVLTGAAADREANQQITGRLGAGNWTDLAGATSLGELGALIARLDLFISVDSGPAHLAAVVGTPLIVLWGPAKLAQVHPLQNGAVVRILREPVPCAPCYDTPAMKTCRANVCMQLIRPRRVYLEAVQILNRKSADLVTMTP